MTTVTTRLHVNRPRPGAGVLRWWRQRQESRAGLRSLSTWPDESGGLDDRMAREVHIIGRRQAG
jgi:hypothetical protein